MSKLVSIVLVSAILLVTLAGCSGDTAAAAAADAQKRVCESNATLQGSISSFASADPDTKVADLKQVKAKLDGPVQLIKTANSVLKQPQLDTMLAAYAELSTTIDGLSGDTLGDASAKIQIGAQALDDALRLVSTALKCSQ